MRTTAAFTMALFMALAPRVSATEVFRLNFANTPGTVTLPYAAGPGDIIGGATIDFDDPYGPGPINAPSFAADSSAPQGDNGVLSLATLSNDGLNVTLGSALSGDFALEVLFRLDGYGDQTTDGIEFGLQSIFGSMDWEASATGRGTAFRVYPNGTIGPVTGTGQIQLNCSNGTETNLDGPTVTVGPTAWHHAVASYDNSTGNVSFYFDGALVGSINPSFGGVSATSEFAIGFWMSGFGTDRSMKGAIDAVVIHDAQVAPGGFSLPVELSVFSAD